MSGAPRSSSALRGRSVTLLIVSEVLERGDVQFFFRPKVQEAEAETFELGVQSLFLILSPAGRKSHRRLRIGKKRMPANGRERFWAKVERVGSLQRVLGVKLEAETYATKTRGDRYQPGARPVAVGSYELVQEGDHIRFEYLAEPFGFDDAPDEITIPERGRHRVLWKRTTGGRGVWTSSGDIAKLDDEGTQIVLVGPSKERAENDDARSPEATRV